MDNNHNYLNKSEQELQSEIESAFQHLQGNQHGAENAVGKILLVIAERNRRMLKSLDDQNKLYTLFIIILTAVGVLPTLINLIRCWFWYL